MVTVSKGVEVTAEVGLGRIAALTTVAPALSKYSASLPFLTTKCDSRTWEYRKALRARYRSLKEAKVRGIQLGPKNKRLHTAFLVNEKYNENSSLHILKCFHTFAVLGLLSVSTHKQLHD